MPTYLQAIKFAGKMIHLQSESTFDVNISFYFENIYSHQSSNDILCTNTNSAVTKYSSKKKNHSCDY